MSSLNRSCLVVVVCAACGGGGASTDGDGGPTSNPDGKPSTADAPANAPCGGPCEAGRRCVANTCQVVSQLYISLGDTTYEAPRPPDQRVQASSWRRVRDAVIDQRPVLGQSGDCTAYGTATAGQYQPTHEIACLDWGTITVDGGPSLPYACTNGGANALAESTGLLAPGSTLTVRGSGGGAFPAFTQTVTLPPRMSAQMSAVRRGDPVTFTWTAASASRVSVILTAIGPNNSWTNVFCNTTDDGTLSIGPDLTQHLPSTVMTSYASVSRYAMVHVEPEGSMTAIDLYTYADQRLDP